MACWMSKGSGLFMPVILNIQKKGSSGFSILAFP